MLCPPVARCMHAKVVLPARSGSIDIEGFVYINALEPGFGGKSHSPAGLDIRP